MQLVRATVLFTALFGFASTTSAIVITSSTDTLLTGSSVITFEEVPVGTPDPTIAGVSFVGDGGALRTIGGSDRVLTNSPAATAGSGPNGINFDINFSSAVSAFGVEVDVINRDVTMSAFNGATLLGSTTFNPGSPFTSVFRGLGGFGTGITSVRFDILQDDIIVLNDFQFVPPQAANVSETGTMLLMAAGLLGLAVRRRRSIALES